MSGGLIWMLVGLGLIAVVARQRSIAVGVVTVQALVLVVVALRDATTGDEVAAAIALGLRAVGLAALFLVLLARTREPHPFRANARPLVRAGLAVGFALTLTWLVPEIGLNSEVAERGVLALIAFGIVTVGTRKATLLQVMGIVLLENGLALAALELPSSSSVVIEIGVALDLTLIALVAAIFHERIFAEFGAGDTSVLRSLRD
jgi:hydrogenase-4 membrane subunit HyfE